MSNVEIIPQTSRDVASSSVLTPMDMLSTAVSQGANIEILEKLMGLQERWEANQARKAYNEAISHAKGEIPPIVKNREVDFTSQKGRTHYKHEDFGQIARIVDPILNKYGLTYRFRAEQNGQRLRVTCILAHRDGYSEESSLEATEDHSGNKNSLQAIGSAATYLQRYTLKLALGLASSNDDDAQAVSVSASSDATDAQLAKIRDLIVRTNTDINEFLKFGRIDSLDDLTAKGAEQAIAMLNRKLAAQEARNA